MGATYYWYPEDVQLLHLLQSVTSDIVSDCLTKLISASYLLKFLMGTNHVYPFFHFIKNFFLTNMSL